MKILAIGDPHGNLDKIKKMPLKKVDLILLTGDLGSSDLMRRIAFENIERRKRGLPEKEYSRKQDKESFMEAYNSTMRLVRHLSRFAPVFTIFGNVESTNHETRIHSREIGLSLPYLYTNLNSMKRVRVINNVLANFSGVRIGGLDYFIDTSWISEFKPSDFMKKMRNAKKETDKAKKVLQRFKSVDILICHQPPYGILDEVDSKSVPKHWKGKHAGSRTILRYIQSKQPKYVFCGHIHEGEGMKRVGRTEVYNLGSCGYKLIEI